MRGHEAESSPILLELAAQSDRQRRAIAQLQAGLLKVNAKNEALSTELKASRDASEAA